MKLSNWASIAEIASGLAVVVTLALLLVGIRDNTAVTRAAMYFDLIDSINEIDRAVWSDPDLSRIQSALFRGQTDELSEADMTRLRQMLVTNFRNLEKGYFAWEYELIGAAEWRRISEAICRNVDLAVSIGLSALELNNLTVEFRDFAGQACG
jgi:hypothetical protein